MKALAALSILCGIVIGVCIGLYLWPVVSPKQVGGSWALGSPYTATLPYPLSLRGTITDVQAETFILDIPAQHGFSEKRLRIHYDTDTRVLVRDPEKMPDGTITNAQLLMATQKRNITLGEKVRADVWFTGKASTPYALILVQSLF